MSPLRSTPDRDAVLEVLRRVGPSTVTDLMRAVGPERNERRQYRQLLRHLVKDRTVVLDRKGRLSLPAVEPEAVPARRRRGGREDDRGRAEQRRGRADEGDERPGEAAGVPQAERGGPDRRGAIVARFEGHPDGFGFVNPTDGTRDVFIPPHRTRGALHGDLVEFRVVGSRPGGRREGTVTRIARPTGQRVVGLVTRSAPAVEVTPFDARSGGRFLIDRRGEPELTEGMAVEIEIPRSGSLRTGLARLVEVLGPISRPGVDIEVLIRKHHLRVPFPESVLEESQAMAGEIPRSELQAREDFSGDCVVTIDGDNAKDFDDAVSIAAHGRGGVALSVYIADVAHYVRPGSPTDIEARLRGTSVYFPGRAIPMLPPALSENVCSLRPEVPRLVQSVIMTFDAQGEPGPVRFTDGWIRSRARLTYGRVNALLKGAPPTAPERELLPDLVRMNTLAERLAARRAARGGLDFDLPEPEVVLDALGAAAGVRPSVRGPAQRLIEEFMIAANIAVAAALVERNVPALHRIHERPDPAKVADLARVVRAFGLEFDVDPGAVEPSDFRRLLEAVADRPEERALGRLILRTMALARYSPQPLGHFGLAASDYLHFTSPIRRYPDLIAHRALRLARAGSLEAPAGRRSGRGAGRASRARGTSGGAARAEARAKGRAASTTIDALGAEDLDVLAADTSRLERVAEGAERESLAWKRAEVLLGRLGEEMDGTVSATAAQGVFVELDEVYAEGLVPMATLPEDRYRFEPERLVIRGERSGRIYRPGQRLRVLVARVDRIAQRVELALARAPAGTGAAVDPRGEESPSAARSNGRQYAKTRGGAGTHGDARNRTRRARATHKRGRR